MCLYPINVFRSDVELMTDDEFALVEKEGRRAGVTRKGYGTGRCARSGA
jgi:hypothetical protein